MAVANIIAIDGPVASGKSTVGSRLAGELGYTFFDTGVMYRAVTWAALQRQVAVADEGDVTWLAETTEIDVRPPSRADGRNTDVLVDGQDVTWEIRRKEVEDHVSQVSAYKGVRLALAAQQRRIGLRGRIVMVGRDIGSDVLPEADLKVYLDASVAVRARRRYEELIQRGQPAVLDEIEEGLRQRDKIDSTRAASPLRVAPGAKVLVTDNLSIEQVVAQIRAWAENGCGPAQAHA